MPGSDDPSASYSLAATSTALVDSHRRQGPIKPTNSKNHCNKTACCSRTCIRHVPSAVDASKIHPPNSSHKLHLHTYIHQHTKATFTPATLLTPSSTRASDSATGYLDVVAGQCCQSAWKAQQPTHGCLYQPPKSLTCLLYTVSTARVKQVDAPSSEHSHLPTYLRLQSQPQHCPPPQITHTRFFSDIAAIPDHTSFTRACCQHCTGKHC